MTFAFSVAEYADMIYVYGFCDSNSVQAVAEYQQRFSNRRIPNRKVCTRVYQTLRATGTLHGVCIAAERDVNEGVDEEEDIVGMVHRSPRTSTRRIAIRLRVPHRKVWRTLHAEGMYPYHVQRVQHLGPGDFAERLKFASGSMTVASCIVTSCLLTNRNSIATVSIIHTTLMCGEIRISMPLWKANFQRFSINEWCAVLDDQLISPFILEGRLTREA